MRTSPIVRQMIRAENSATIRHLSPGMAVTVSGLKGSAVVEQVKRTRVLVLAEDGKRYWAPARQTQPVDVKKAERQFFAGKGAVVSTLKRHGYNTEAR